MPLPRRHQCESNAFSISDSDTEDVTSRHLNQSFEGRNNYILESYHEPIVLFTFFYKYPFVFPALTSLEHQLAELLVPFLPFHFVFVFQFEAEYHSFGFDVLLKTQFSYVFVSMFFASISSNCCQPKIVSQEVLTMTSCSTCRRRFPRPQDHFLEDHQGRLFLQQVLHNTTQHRSFKS